MRRVWWFLAFLTVGPASAEEPWPGEWRVVGTTEVRRLEEREGRLRLELLAGPASDPLGPARVSGPPAARLELTGELQRPAGIVGALEGREGRPPLPVRVVVE